MSSLVRIRSGQAWRTVSLDDYVDPIADEQSHVAANRWIKQLRHLAVDGEPLRRRFTVRGDSLWWFTELYLHKQQAIRGLFRTIAALESLKAAESPHEIEPASGAALEPVIDAFAVSRGVGGPQHRAQPRSRTAVARLDARSAALAAAAYASRLRPGRSSEAPQKQLDVAAFVHRAFWRPNSETADAESYIGPVLAELSHRLPPDALSYIGVGPRENFRARRWWHAARPATDTDVVIPIEQFAPASVMRDASRIWAARHANRRLLWASRDIRDHSVIDGCDCWPIVRLQLAGVALLQWPWSVRAMDEAAAALDRLKPGAAITYAEAGGWGRALMLEARRRGIPTAGLQHGFIYRHWLNYLHEPDEMRADPGNDLDTGFPKPTRTLLFDQYAARHLIEAGAFVPGDLVVTGSSRLDALVAEAATVTTGQIQQVRDAAGANSSQAVVAVFTKYREAAHLLPALVAAVASRRDIQLIIKAHPAETTDVYAPVAAGVRNVVVVGAASRLAPLLRACRAIVTVNSTVALDAAVLHVPALVLGASGNLQPFVDAGLMAGAPSPAAVPDALARILYDGEFRGQLEGRQRALLAEYGIRADGHAAARSAEAILELVPRGAASRQRES